MIADAGRADIVGRVVQPLRGREGLNTDRRRCAATDGIRRQQ
jgi:hypothetical protein